jgi:hypothetical protein
MHSSEGESIAGTAETRIQRLIMSLLKEEIVSDNIFSLFD